jgi:hypothetical protein
VTRDATTAERAEGLRKELELLNREQEDILNKDKEVKEVLWSRIMLMRPGFWVKILMPHRLRPRLRPFYKICQNFMRKKDYPYWLQVFFYDT